jgi:predicted nucleotidyltransferase
MAPLRHRDAHDPTLERGEEHDRIAGPSVERVRPLELLERFLPPRGRARRGRRRRDHDRTLGHDAVGRFRQHVCVVKVDERAVVPPVDAAARTRLAAALDRPPVVAASLIGSQAGGRPGPLSDVDVAVWLEPDAPSMAQLSLLAAAVRALGTDEIDLVVLNHAPPLLQHRAMTNRIPLVERDRAQRVRFETDALLAYLDTASLRAVLAEGRRRRVAEGRFGRR